ncbi:hypothetical protein GCM10009433_00400 [Psychroflexus lacisalsi]|uniref:O-antigen ligase-related domain-containing protein n=2 Tax=Psychroflexus lacisalsi TaxID=503928 RepID=A0ABN1K067_9FLAO
MYMGLNNVILGIFLVWMILKGVKDKAYPSWKTLKAYLPIFLFFILALIASINNTDLLFLKHLESYWSFLLVPVAFSFQQEKTKALIPYAFKGLIYGSAATLMLCYANAVFEIISYNEPWSYFLRWRHLSHNFTEIADTHPAYLGLFICTSTYFLLFYTKSFNYKLKTFILSLFLFGILQLASRVALVIFLMTFLIYIFSFLRKNLKFVIGGVLLVFLVSLLFISQGSAYFIERLSSSESITKDSRFNRLEISYNIFKENPLFGIGFDRIDEQRIRKYKESGFYTAAEKKYNSHNQFFEYLSLNGMIGALVYMGVFIYLIVISLKDRNYLFLFLVITFFVANLTESMMVRIKGIEYFSIFISLFLINRKVKE